MSVDFEMLKKVDLNAEYLVHGYFREYEMILLNIGKNNPYYNIPELSIYVTLSYYCIIECFSIIPENVELSEDKTCILKEEIKKGADSEF